MEKNIAILMADLSGYTALTETHGSLVAADLIDKYVEIIKECLYGDCHFHERTGDEVMIVSSSANELLITAEMILKRTISENNFLQVHGGLHYGKILERNNNYFGSTINITSRIVSKAKPGTFWCSEEFVTALPGKAAFKFLLRGKHNLKNITAEVKMFELRNENSRVVEIDPVCRMLINKKDPVSYFTEHSVSFCSQACLDIYTKNMMLN